MRSHVNGPLGVGLNLSPPRAPSTKANDKPRHSEVETALEKVYEITL